MKTFLSEIKISLLLTLVFAGLLCGAYPLAVFAGAQLLFPAKANGSLIADSSGAVHGSQLLAQSFTSAKYFWPRPSAAGTGYDATSSSGTNLGPTSQKLADRIKAAVAAYRTANGLAPNSPVPADAVTFSASGLDPHISPANARLQAARVAKARGLPLEKISALIAANTAGRDLGVFGEPGVNVVTLNLALDALRSRRSPTRAFPPSSSSNFSAPPCPPSTELPRADRKRGAKNSPPSSPDSSWPGSSGSSSSGTRRTTVPGRRASRSTLRPKPREGPRRPGASCSACFFSALALWLFLMGGLFLATVR